jgi:hypothetical protein
MGSLTAADRLVGCERDVVHRPLALCIVAERAEDNVDNTR